MCIYFTQLIKSFYLELGLDSKLVANMECSCIKDFACTHWQCILKYENNMKMYSSSRTCILIYKQH